MQKIDGISSRESAARGVVIVVINSEIGASWRPRCYIRTFFARRWAEDSRHEVYYPITPARPPTLESVVPEHKRENHLELENSIGKSRGREQKPSLFRCISVR